MARTKIDTNMCIFEKSRNNVYNIYIAEGSVVVLHERYEK